MESLNINLALDTIYVYGKVNGVEADFTLSPPQTWMATVDKAEDNKYVVEITAYNSLGTATEYSATIYKLNDLIPPKLDWFLNDYYNYTDLNRVEANIQCVSENLKDMGYNPTLGQLKDWMIGDFPTISEINRIENNLETLATHFYKPHGWGNKKTWNPGMKFDYRDANRFERNLSLLMETIKLIKDDVKYSGTFSAGEEVL